MVWILVGLLVVILITPTSFSFKARRKTAHDKMVDKILMMPKTEPVCWRPVITDEDFPYAPPPDAI